ncbi:MAG: sterol carrier family protein [Actinomycetes bacterium]
MNAINMKQDPAVLAEVLATLDLLAKKFPGKAIEVRIPPYAAIQCGQGPRHTRGTPPNVIEMAATTWLALASGATTWADALRQGAIDASGSLADLSAHLPLTELTDLTDGVTP